MLLTKWAADWSETKTSDDVVKAFQLCGVVPEEDFDLEKLHLPLKEIFNNHISIESWISNHAAVISSTTIPLETFMDFEGKHVVLQAIYAINSCNDDESFKDWLIQSIEQIIKTLRQDPFTAPIFQQVDEEIIKSGAELTSGRFEAYAVSKLIGSPIHLTFLDDSGLPLNRVVFGEIENGQIYGFFLQTKPVTKLYYDPTYDPRNFVDYISETESSSSDDEGHLDAEEEHLDAEEEHLDAEEEHLDAGEEEHLEDGEYIEDTTNDADNGIADDIEITVD